MILPLRLIQSVTLEGFRGWRCKKTIETDGNIVLLTGANGLGKTSLLEAIGLLLSGYSLRQYASIEEAQSRDLLLTIGCARFGIEASALTSDGSSLRLSLSHQKGRSREAERSDNEYWSAVKALVALGDGKLALDLFAVTTTLFHEQLTLVLDEFSGERRSSLAEWFAPLDRLLGRLDAKLKSLISEHHRTLYAEEEAGPVEPSTEVIALSRRFAQLWNELRAELGKHEALADLAGSMPEAPNGLEAYETLLSFARRLRSGERQHNYVDAAQSLHRALQRLKERIVPHLEQHAERLRVKLARLEQEFPEEKRRDIVRAFEHHDVELGTWLEKFRTGLAHWSISIITLSSAHPELEALAKELGSLDLGQLAALTASSRSFAQPWQRAEQRVQEIEGELGRLASKQLDATWMSLELVVERFRREAPREDRRREDRQRKLRQRARRRASETALPVMQELLQALTGVQQRNESFEQVKPVIADAINQTLTHFAGSLGKVRLESSSHRDREGLELFTELGLRWADVSSGQKHQLALAYVLAQALVLRPELPHRVLLFDDTSSAFDLDNVVRQAAWLRQLAYCPDREHRWQVFLSCHDEAVARRLRELLAPPLGLRLVEVKFRSWSPQNGPTVDVQENPPAENGSELAAEDMFKQQAMQFENAFKYHMERWAQLRSVLPPEPRTGKTLS